MTEKNIVKLRGLLNMQCLFNINITVITAAVSWSEHSRDLRWNQLCWASWVFYFLPFRSVLGFCRHQAAADLLWMSMRKSWLHCYFGSDWCSLTAVFIRLLHMHVCARASFSLSLYLGYNENRGSEDVGGEVKETPKIRWSSCWTFELKCVGIWKKFFFSFQNIQVSDMLNYRTTQYNKFVYLYICVYIYIWCV